MKAPRRVLVGVKQAADVEALVSLATRVAAPRQAVMVALHVIELPDVVPLDTRDRAWEKPVRAIKRAVERQERKHPRRKFTLRTVRAYHAGRAIVSELKKGKFELAILGYHHKRTLGELIFGTTAQYLLKHAPCRLLMSVPASR